MATQTADIPVELGAGGDCGECAERLRAALAHHRGLVGVEPAGPAALRVAYDPDLCSLSCVTEAADAIGSGLTRRFHHEVVPIEGMDCYDCAQTIERAVGRVEGVTSCSVNFAAARLRVEYESGGATADPAAANHDRYAVAARIRSQVERLGYRLATPAPVGTRTSGPIGEAAAAAGEGFLPRYRHELDTAVAALLLLAGVAASAAGLGVAPVALYVSAIAVGGRSVARSGIAALRATHRPDINLLMTLAVIGAGAIGAWLEAALVVVLFSVGEALEHRAVERARRSLGDVLTLAPETANLRRGGGTVEVAVADLVVGDEVVVKPGERIPADGLVVDGASAVDQALITGESGPVDPAPGDEVFAGTLNGEGRLGARVGRAPGDTTLDRIARAVAEAQAQKSPAERWVDRFAHVYTPLVLVVAAVTAVVPPLLGAGSFADWVYRGLAFLILACPCALVISTPVSVVSALGRASAAGVLVKGGAHLETAASVRAVAFDKTGTLTAGHPQVVEVVAMPGRTADDVLARAASLEAASEHPLARAVVDAAARAGLPLAAVEGFAARRGFGVEGALGGRRVRVGKPGLFEDHDGLHEASAAVGRLESEGRTVALVGEAGRVIGVIALSDTVRPGAAEAVAALERAGVERTVMLTGDHRAAGAAVGAAAGVDEVRAELLPEDKVAAVADLQAAYGTVAMVGDGVNDAPALARSSLGIAMGSAGSPTAIETADIALMGDDLAKLAELIHLARWTRSVVRQNISLSLAVKAVAAVANLVGYLPLWVAVVADVGATLVVVANGLRLLRTGPLAGRLRAEAMLGGRRGQGRA
ncbi:MAG: cation-translocating P-type ATPase [Actinobacteria bacterium]|nr:cation-translocating P-type ATPase [Actinomycetota bacterium]